MSELELTQAIRRPSERRALVEAVVGGGATLIETDFLEWKTAFDLQLVRFRAATAKHILAFANRHPDRAQRNLEGYAYLLIGVEPGQLVGVPEAWDPEKLESWLTPYVGEAVAWDPHYVEVQGQKVLVIAVDPPRWGDPPHPLRMESEDELGKALRAGTIYIRRPGKSEQATAVDIDMLTERARAGARRLSLTLELASQPPRAIPSATLSAEHRDAALQARHQQLLRGVPETEPKVDIGMFATDIRMPDPNEPRSPERYRAEVAAYIEQCRQRWSALVAVEAAETRYSPLQLQVRNDSDHVYESVQVEVTLPLDPSWIVKNDSEAQRRFKPPKPPAPWGNHLAGLTSRFALDAVAPAAVELEPRTTAEGTTKFLLARFLPLLVRPRSIHPLDELLLLLPPALAGAEIPLRWRATSASTTGELKGEQTLQVQDEH